MKYKAIAILYILFSCFLNFHLLAGDNLEKDAKKDERKAAVSIAAEEKLSVTHHSIKIAGEILKYQATVGCMKMKDESEKEKASVFFIAYSKDTGNPDPARPITFAFNGGPGSAALWLHMGALGPQRVAIPAEGLSIPPPYKYVDNEQTWLTFTDLVFIDPVSTGYSRPAQGVDKKEFHGVKEDVHSVGDFIRLYVTKYKRWLSPKFICGESYGTTRAAGLSDYLQDRYGMYLTGVILVSSVLNFQNDSFTPGNDLPYAIFLPTYTATAWYHKKLPPRYQNDLRITLKEVEEWALEDYILALAKGDDLSRQERENIIEKLCQYTGLSKAFIDEVNLRIPDYRFFQELLRQQKLTVGRLDSRLTGRGKAALDAWPESDPSMDAFSGAFTAVINDYIRQELKYSNDLPYEAISRNVHPWNWGSAIRGHVNVTDDLRRAMSANKYLKVLFVCGYYDLATPYFAAIYTAKHLNLPEDLRGNMSFTFYEAGHMVYIHKPSLIKLQKDASQFYQEALH